jgi:putative redox protein
MSADTERSVSIRRRADGQLVARNVRGGELPIRSDTDSDHFSPIELMLAAIAGCTALDVHTLTARRAEPESFEVDARADKIRDESGNRLDNIEVVFRVQFPDGAAGDEARRILPDMVARSHDRLCTVSRTVELGTQVATRID